MAYFVVCTFDLYDNATSSDYEDAYSELSALGLERVVIGNSNKECSLPNTTVAGEFTGESTGSVRDSLTNDISSAFNRHNLNFKFFLNVSRGYAWSTRNS